MMDRTKNQKLLLAYHFFMLVSFCIQFLSQLYTKGDKHEEVVRQQELLVLRPVHHCGRGWPVRLCRISAVGGPGDHYRLGCVSWGPDPAVPDQQGHRTLVIARRA